MAISERKPAGFPAGFSINRDPRVTSGTLENDPARPQRGGQNHHHQHANWLQVDGLDLQRSAVEVAQRLIAQDPQRAAQMCMALQELRSTLAALRARELGLL